MLAELNVWVDVLATGFMIAAVMFWLIQITGNSLTGRFRHKFRYGQWPDHDEIVPVVPRVLHFIHVGTFLTLAVSGLYIRFPFYPGLRPLNQHIHFIAMYVVVAFMLIRILYALFKDGKQFILTKQDIQVMPQALLYYGFFRKQYPHIHKYNGLQKFTYGYVFPIGLTGMALTGFAMMWPNKLLGWAESVGTAVAYTRVSHFMLAAILVMFVLIHICLSFVEDYPALMIFFGLHRQYWEEDYDEYYEDDEEFASVTADAGSKNKVKSEGKNESGG